MTTSQQSAISMPDLCDLVSLLTTADPSANVDLPDSKGRTLLSYSVESGDAYVGLTRLLINLGAQTTHSDQFGWFLRAQMRKMGAEAELDEETFYVLSTAMMEELGGSTTEFKSIIDRSMLTHGSSPAVHGPLFRRIRALAAPLWLQPQQLRALAVKSVRKALGPKRLSKEVMKRLKVPRKLQRFVTLEEKIPTSN